jgi:hypothetical protein
MELRIVKTEKTKRAYYYYDALVRWMPIPYKEAMEALEDGTAKLSKIYHPNGKIEKVTPTK